MQKPPARKPLTLTESKFISNRQRMELESLEKNWLIVAVKNKKGGFVPTNSLPTEPTEQHREDIGNGKKLCPVCSGVGVIECAQRGADTGLARYWNFDCYCRQYKQLQKFLDDSITPRYRNVRLSELKPNAYSSLSEEKQREEIQFIQDNPDTSYTFFGPAGTSKTTYAIALYRYALEQAASTIGNSDFHGIRSVWRVDAKDLLDQHRAKELDPEAPEPVVTKRRIVEAVKKYQLGVLVVIDEFDKMKNSKFKMDAVFEIINCLYEHNCRVIICSNMEPKEFENTFGEALYRRVVDMGEVRNYFEKI
jgi:DNA replication protein DnaC